MHNDSEATHLLLVHTLGIRNREVFHVRIQKPRLIEAPTFLTCDFEGFPEGRISLSHPVIEELVTDT